VGGNATGDPRVRCAPVARDPFARTGTGRGSGLSWGTGTLAASVRTVGRRAPPRAAIGRSAGRTVAVPSCWAISSVLILVVSGGFSLSPASLSSPAPPAAPGVTPGVAEHAMDVQPPPPRLGALPADPRPANSTPLTHWWNITSESPTPLPVVWFTEATWDAADDYLVFYGGDNFAGTLYASTWTYAHGLWHNLSTHGSPGPVDGAALAYDPNAGQVVMYGGASTYTPVTLTNETWLFSRGNWGSVRLNPTPTERDAGSMVFDPDLGGVVLFGGYGPTSSQPMLNDLWLYKNGSWSRLPDSNPPPVRAWANLGFDPTLHELVLFSGIGLSGTCIGDTWTYSDGVWAQLSAAPVGEPALCAAAMTYDPDLGHLVLAGGVHFTTTTDAIYYRGTYAFNGSAWNDVAPGGTGPDFLYGVFGWDPDNREFVEAGGTSGYTATDVLSLPLIVENVTAPTSADVGQNLSFGATIGGGVPQRTISWTWGDGTQTSGPANTTHTYSAAGTYDVAVQVVDANGSIANGSATVVVANSLTTAIASPAAGGDVGVPVSFRGVAVGGSGAKMLSWSFGDGANAAGVSVAHTYTAPGRYEVQLQATDSVGYRSVSTENLTIAPPPAVTVVAPPMGEVGSSIAFDGTVVGGTSPYMFVWSYDDGQTGTGPSVTHTFLSSGTHDAYLTVVDAANGSATAQAAVQVVPGLSIRILGPTALLLGQTGTWSSNTSGGEGPVTIEWTLPNGTVLSGPRAGAEFGQPGYYVIQVNATDALGASSGDSVGVTVSAPPAPTGTFGGVPIVVLIGGIGGIAMAAIVAVYLVHRRRTHA